MSALHYVESTTADPICNRVPRAVAVCTGFTEHVTCKRCLAALVAKRCRCGHVDCKACRARSRDEEERT